MTDATIENPILNSPYDPPDSHWEIGVHGPTGDVRAGRRPSESWIPVAPTRKGRRYVDEELDFESTLERREKNSLINDLRREMERWRRTNYQGVTPTTRKLLLYWSDPDRGEERVLYCQREAVETAIFLAEVAGRHGYTDWRKRIEPHNEEHNAGLPRVALKMATGSGKTVVMAMLIAWHTLNKAAKPSSNRFTNKFLIVTPGITIRDRLRVLTPSDQGNYYDERYLIPPELRSVLNQAQVVITNYHSFLLKDAKEIRGVAATTRKLLLQGKSQDVFKETPEAMVSRVLRSLAVTGPRKQAIVVFNDEAHHCYQDKPIRSDKLSKEEQEANEEARVWFRGLQAIRKYAGIKTVYDLSATPFYLNGSGYQEGFIFPWTVSDFSLMDAIESGIVKVPRIPVDDDSDIDEVTYLNLWDLISDRLPKRKVSVDNWVIPSELQGALESLHRSYRRSFEHWEQNLAALGEPPPVYIVVCPNTVVSKLVADWIGGEEVEGQDGQVHYKPGNLDLLSNVVDGRPLAKPRTILIDSAQLESGEALTKDFRAAAGPEIEAFKTEYRLRNPGADIDQISDEDLLREVMNTVGKKGRLGESVRCVVSVAMLTEGWDANTVTHILGIRAFKSQLLCEQVVGRGLRRRSYALNDEGRFEPEYAQVYGIPFAFIPSDKVPPDVKPRPPALEVGSVPGRDEDFRIQFPRLEGYRVEIPDARLNFDAELTSHFAIGPNTVPNWVEAAGVVGSKEHDQNTDAARYRTQEVAFALARRLLDVHLSPTKEDRRPWLFPRLVQICRTWLESCVDIAAGFHVGHLMIAEFQAEAAEAIYHAITVYVGERRERLRPMMRRFQPVGHTGEVHFLTRKRVVPTEKSEVSHVTLDGKDGNTWEETLAGLLEAHPDVAAYVKNDHLDFTIPYVHKGRTHAYVPDFLVRLKRIPGEEFDRHLVIEVSGGLKSHRSPGSIKEKARTARDSWCVAVNNDQRFGRWGYAEFTSVDGMRTSLDEAIRGMYADDPIVGDPELLDYDETSRGVARGA